MIQIAGSSFIDEHNRVLMLRGVNLGGSSKVPFTPDGSTYRSEGFFNHRDVSFVGRPFLLEDADEHYSRLRAWGFNTLRFLVTWEAIEHAGPGILDTEYLDYLYKVVRKAGEHGFMVFIDPHQDVWSRFSGGDGAPGWTFETVGLDITKFKSTAAAIVHQTHGDPFPRMIWPTNATKLAAATMFTLFFAGNVFAPATLVDGVPVQDYLQSHFLAAVRKVAERLADLDCVIGYDVFNEPQKGFVGLKDLRGNVETWKMGITPTPWQAIQLAAGYAQRVPVYPYNLLSLQVKKHLFIDPGGERAWLPDRNCVWRENGVWDLDESGVPRLLRPDHFAKAGNRTADYSRDHLLPFTQKFAETIHSVAPGALIFMENEVDDPSPAWREAPRHKIVYAPHWYDGITLITKRLFPALGSHARRRSPVIGKRNIKRSYANQLAELKEEARQKLGNVPVLIGEIGIPYDMHNRQAYIDGDFYLQAKAMDRSMRPIEENLLNCTLWNYTADNINAHGDRWNDEDLSIYSPDQRVDHLDINSGGRALEAVVRPYPIATAGVPQTLSFDYETKEFRYTFTNNEESILSPTTLYVPRIQYPFGIKIQISDGEYRYHADKQLLEYYPGNLESHIIRLSPGQQQT